MKFYMHTLYFQIKQNFLSFSRLLTMCWVIGPLLSGVRVLHEHDRDALHDAAPGVLRDAYPGMLRDAAHGELLHEHDRGEHHDAALDVRLGAGVHHDDPHGSHH